MNPLCCIAPVSTDKDRTNPVVVKVHGQFQLGQDDLVRNVNFSHKQKFSPQISNLSQSDCEGIGPAAVTGNQEVDELYTELKDSKAGAAFDGGVNGSVAGALYKWVNYGKGWRPRWFVLEDGVLSYYKIHGPHKILTSPVKEKSVRVIGKGSLRYMRKDSWNGNKVSEPVKQWKTFGEVHLKVSVIG